MFPVLCISIFPHSTCCFCIFHLALFSFYCHNCWLHPICVNNSYKLPFFQQVAVVDSVVCSAPALLPTSSTYAIQRMHQFQDLDHTLWLLFFCLCWCGQQMSNIGLLHPLFLLACLPCFYTEWYFATALLLLFTSFLSLSWWHHRLFPFHFPMHMNAVVQP